MTARSKFFLLLWRPWVTSTLSCWISTSVVYWIFINPKLLNINLELLNFNLKIMNFNFALLNICLVYINFELLNFSQPGVVEYRAWVVEYLFSCWIFLQLLNLCSVVKYLFSCWISVQLLNFKLELIISTLSCLGYARCNTHTRDIRNQLIASNVFVSTVPVAKPCNMEDSGRALPSTLGWQPNSR